jgi:hypothetical protein
MRPYLKNNQHKKGWQSGSSGSMPALQAQAPKFNHQNQKNKKLSKQDTSPYTVLKS